MAWLVKSLWIVLGGILAGLAVTGSVSPARTATWPPPLLPQATWTSDFSTGDFTEWSWWGQGQEHLWGHIDVTTPREAGIPALAPSLPRVARMTVTRSDVRRGSYHAKLYQGFEVPAGEDRSRPPADVSGTYSAWYYLPDDYEITGDSWTNLFQFKEQHGERSDPLWWVQLGGARWARGFGGPRRWTGEPPRGADVVAFLNYWGNDFDRRMSFVTVPRGRWFEVRAELRQRNRIDFYLDGRRFDTARASEYPVSPFRRDAEEWTFGVGNYSTAPNNTLYVGAASYRPGTSSATAAGDSPRTAAEASAP